VALGETARLDDAYEADLAAAFPASHDIAATRPERFQTTLDPLMQRALGIRLLAPAPVVDEARRLLARAEAGEFASDDGDDIPSAAPAVRIGGSILALATAATGVFWGPRLPRRFRPFAWQGALWAALAVAAVCAALGVLMGLPFDRS